MSEMSRVVHRVRCGKTVVEPGVYRLRLDGKHSIVKVWYHSDADDLVYAIIYESGVGGDGRLLMPSNRRRYNVRSASHGTWERDEDGDHLIRAAADTQRDAAIAQHKLTSYLTETYAHMAAEIGELWLKIGKWTFGSDTVQYAPVNHPEMGELTLVEGHKVEVRFPDGLIGTFSLCSREWAVSESGRMPVLDWGVIAEVNGAQAWVDLYQLEINRGTLPCADHEDAK